MANGGWRGKGGRKLESGIGREREREGWRERERETCTKKGREGEFWIEGTAGEMDGKGKREFDNGDRWELWIGGRKGGNVGGA